MNAEERKVFLETVALMNQFGANQLKVTVEPDPWHPGENNLYVKIDCGVKHVEFVTCGYCFLYSMQRLTKNEAVDYYMCYRRWSMKSYWVIESIVAPGNYLGTLDKEDYVGINFDYAERFHTKKDAEKRLEGVDTLYQNTTMIKEIELPGVETEHLFLDSLQTGGYHIRDKSDFHIVGFLMGTDDVPSVKYLNYYEEKCYTNRR